MAGVLVFSVLATGIRDLSVLDVRLGPPVPSFAFGSIAAVMAVIALV